MDFKCKIVVKGADSAMIGALFEKARWRAVRERRRLDITDEGAIFSFADPLSARIFVVLCKAHDVRFAVKDWPIS